MSSQPGCGDVCQKWMCLKESNGYCKIKSNFKGDINERNFDTHHPWCQLSSKSSCWMNLPIFSNESICLLLVAIFVLTHICVSSSSIFGLYNGVSPGRHWAIIWTNAGILLFIPLATNFNAILMKTSFRETVRFYSGKCIWKCRLRNGGHFVSPSMC